MGFMHCFKGPLVEWSQNEWNKPILLWPHYMYKLLTAASAFRRRRSVEVMLSMWRRMWPSNVSCPDSMLCRAMIDAVRGELD